MIGAELIDSSRREVAAGGYLWTVEKPRNDVLLAHGVAWIDVLPAQAKREAVADGKVTPETARALASQLTGATLLKLQEATARTASALCCAGVVAVRRGAEDPPEAIRFCDDPGREDREKGHIWIERIDAATRDALAGAIRDLLGEEVGSRVARFRGPA